MLYCDLGGYMSQDVKIDQYLDQRMISPATENFITIDENIYATGKDGKGLYKLIPPDKAYFFNEAIPLNEKFRLNNNLNEEKKKEVIIKELHRLKNKFNIY